MHAQVVIPDTAFVSILQEVVPDAMNENVLDTTDASVLSLNSLHLNYNVNDLDGLRYFTGLDSLSVRFGMLTTLAEVPDGVKWLDLSGSLFDVLPNDLPDSLEFLDCSFTSIHTFPTVWPHNLRSFRAYSAGLTALPSLPVTLQYLNVTTNDLVTIDELPPGLVEFICVNTGLTALPPLPATLRRLDARVDHLTSLPALPSGMQYLSVGYNELTALPDLPADLIELDLPYNHLASLPELPAGLQRLSANNNQLTELPALPDGMDYLYILRNQITTLPTLPHALTMLYATENQLTELPELPAGLELLYVNVNPIDCLPELPATLTQLICAQTGITCLPNIPPEATYWPGNLGFTPVVCGPDQECFLPPVNTGIPSFDLYGGNLVSPNPTSDHTTLQHTISPGRSGTFLLYDAIGKVVYRTTIAGGTGSLSISTASLDPGTYHYLLTDGVKRPVHGEISVVR